MQLKKVGRTGLKVTPICSSTMTPGGQVPDAESIELTQKALDAGINLIDTADGCPMEMENLKAAEVNLPAEDLRVRDEVWQVASLRRNMYVR